MRISPFSSAQGRAALLCSSLTIPLTACGDAPGQSSSGANSDEHSTGAASGDGDDTGGGPGASDDPGQGEASGTGDDGKPDVCETLDARADPRPPEVLIVLDRSGSMAGERWDRVIAAIDQVTAAFPELLFGLSMYPAVGEELACKSGKLDVAPAASTAEPIHDALFADAARAIQDVGYTPTRATLESAAGYFTDLLENPHERFVLLVTDGQPNCARGGPTNATADLEGTLSALATLERGGIRTFVFGYLTAQFAATMDQLAVAGGTEHHYAVEDEATILGAFEQISSSLAPCTFELENDVPGVEFVRVELDGKDVPYGADGFTMQGGRTIELGAASCAVMRDGGHHSIEVTVECQPVRVL